VRSRRRPIAFGLLLGLFVVPILVPKGVPGLEGRVDGALQWVGRLGLSTPSGPPTGPSGDADASRARDLALMNLEQRERYYHLLDETSQCIELREATRGFERLPLARAARVLRASDASPMRRSILIDVGADDGIVEGLAVVQGGVLVGFVQRADAHTSRVQLLTDPGAKTAAAIRTSDGARATGWLRGGAGDTTLLVRNLRAVDGTRVRDGDPVLTGNADERVPAGLLIGKVVASEDIDLDERAELRVRPLFDLVRTTTVLVLVPPP
jgi:hypothetical protein